MNFDELLKKAISGDYYAQEQIALRYANGDGIKRDYEKAKEFFIKANKKNPYDDDDDDQYSMQRTPLMVAVMSNDIERVKLLLKIGFDVNETDSAGNTALHAATGRNRLEIVKLLIKNNADINAKGYGDRTPLMNAIEEGDTELVELLNAKKKPIVDKEAVVTALKRNQIETAMELIKNGADVNTGELHWHTPLTYAAQNNNLDLAKLLVEYGADVNASSSFGTPLQAAVTDSVDTNSIECRRLVENVHMDIIKHLNLERMSIQDFAFKYHPKATIIAFLINHGADPELDSYDRKWSATKHLEAFKKNLLLLHSMTFQ